MAPGFREQLSSFDLAALPRLIYTIFLLCWHINDVEGVGLLPRLLVSLSCIVHKC